MQVHFLSTKTSVASVFVCGVILQSVRGSTQYSFSSFILIFIFSPQVCYITICCISIELNHIFGAVKLKSNANGINISRSRYTSYHSTIQQSIFQCFVIETISHSVVKSLKNNKNDELVILYDVVGLKEQKTKILLKILQCNTRCVQ